MEADLVKELQTLVSVFNWVSVVASIFSIVLAIVSLVLAIVFYHWGNKFNSEMTHIQTDIKSNVESLTKLFDKMFDTTFKMIEKQNEAMQNKLFATGTTGSQESLNFDFEVISFIINKKNCSKQEILTAISNLKQEQLDAILDRISKKNSSISINGESVSFIEKPKTDMSEKGLGDSGNA